ncbi:UNVERIFIED_CONTAM: Transcription factor-like protein DPB [Sesamum radiatum]|uniref:Transcription factor-like protein DPB n=1 Tax=Sesamum radiatum TaxID=300843 RepID=A0AAW2TIL5_SESRA
MVNHSNDNNNSNQEDGDKNPSTMSKGGGGGATRSWGTTISGQSMSTSGSMGSPSSRSEAAMATPASDSTFVRLNNLDIQGDDAGSQGPAGNRKKKRGQRAVGGDKSGRGLRQFSMKVCEKVESKGRTTYNEVADELVAEFADPNNNLASPDQQQYDEKNIRRRVYDALNVLMAMDIISKDKKEIQWKGLPRTSLNDIEELKTERLGLRSRIEKKAAYLEELEEQYVGLQNLIQRNEQLYGSGNAPSGGVALPFILVQTRPHATVEVEISEDMQLVHFDFNSTPFELHDDNYVLKAMKFCEKPQVDGAGTSQHLPTTDGGESSSMANAYQPQIPHPSRPTVSGRPPTSPPLPGILKARVKHEH